MCHWGNSGQPAVTLTKWLKWCVHARYMKVLSVTVSTFKRRMEKKLGERREKWGVMHRLVVSFWDCFTVTLGGLMLLYLYMVGGLVVLPRRNFGRICAELWYSGPTWTKNSAYRTVPFPFQEMQIFIILGKKVVGLWNTSVLFPLCGYYTTKYGESPRSTSKYETVLCLRAKDKYRGMFEIQQSGDKTKSGEIGLDIRTHASPKVGHDQVSGGVSVLCWYAAPVAYVLWKPCTII